MMSRILLLCPWEAAELLIGWPENGWLAILSDESGWEVVNSAGLVSLSRRFAAWPPYAGFETAYFDSDEEAYLLARVVCASGIVEEAYARLASESPSSLRIEDMEW
jgi:hypothetical protein